MINKPHISSPKIKIENGTTKCFETTTPQKPKKEQKKSEMKNSLDVKKDSKKNSSDTLDVSVGGEHRRHKHTDHKSTTQKRKEDEPKEKSKGAVSKQKLETKTKQTKVKTSQNENGVNKNKDKDKKSGKKLVKQSSVRGIGEEALPTKEKTDTAPSVKPPNVLVYADSAATKDNVKRVLYSILNKEK